jgi:hypothetical protein
MIHATHFGGFVVHFLVETKPLAGGRAGMWRSFVDGSSVDPLRVSRIVEKGRRIAVWSKGVDMTPDVETIIRGAMRELPHSMAGWR